MWLLDYLFVYGNKHHSFLSWDKISSLNENTTAKTQNKIIILKSFIHYLHTVLRFHSKHTYILCSSELLMNHYGFMYIQHAFLHVLLHSGSCFSLWYSWKKTLIFSMTPCCSILTHSSFTWEAEYIKERWRIKEHCAPFGWTLKENKEGEHCNLHVALDTLFSLKEKTTGDRIDLVQTPHVFAFISPDHFQVLNVRLTMSAWVTGYKLFDLDINLWK